MGVAWESAKAISRTSSTGTSPFGSTREVRILGDAEARARSLSDEVFWLRHALEVSKAGKEKLKAWPLARNGCPSSGNLEPMSGLI